MDFVVVVLSVLAGVMWNGVVGIPAGAMTNRNLDQAKRLLDENILIDGHNDWPYMLRINFDNQLGRVDLNNINKEQYNLIANKGATHTDILRLREGRVGAQFWAVNNLS